MSQLEVFSLSLGRFKPQWFSLSVTVVLIRFQIGIFWLFFVIFLPRDRFQRVGGGRA